MKAAHVARCTRGSALAWAVCLMLVLTVLLTGMAGIAGAYQRRGARELNESHAYLAASGALEAVLSLIDGAVIEIPFEEDSAGNASAVPTEESIRARIATALPLLPLSEGERVELTDFDLAEMVVDSVNGYIERVSPVLWRVSVTASRAQTEKTMSALLALEITAAGEFREQKAADFARFGAIFHANLFESLTFSAENSALFAPGGALYLGSVASNGGAQIEPGTALFTRETLALSADGSRALRARGGDVLIINGERFSGEMPGFGYVFLPETAINRTNGAFMLPGLDALAGGANVRAISGECSLAPGALPEGARLYLFLQPGAKLTLSGAGGDALVYIYAPEGTRVIAEGGLALRGAVVAHDMEIAANENGGARVEITYEAPPDGELSAETGALAVRVYPAGAFDYKWSFVRYE